MSSAVPPKNVWQPPSAEELQALLPEYEVTSLLGRGGMGAVYRGRQLSLDRPVAIKILSADLDESDMGFAERFKNEARAMAKLSHPGIVAVYDFGQTENELLYIVMEFIEGTDVARMITNQGRLHTDHAMAVTAHVCDALAYAHERGIIHRDIKPANIMVSYDGVVKVADFGLAKMTAGNEEAGLTQSGMAMGTLHYMAPEALILGTRVDHRADIYAMGVMLYQMLTGKLPQGLFEMPSLQVAGLDPRYDGIISKALREDRSVRYQSVTEMRRDLDSILTQPVVKVAEDAKQAPAALSTTARPQRPDGQAGHPHKTPALERHSKDSSQWLWVAAMVVIGLAICLFVSLFKSAPASGKVADASISMAETKNKSTSTTITGSSSPATATKELPWVNSLGMKFVPVPDTQVLFCTHETRRQDYAAYAAASPNVNGLWRFQNINGIGCGAEEDHPVCGVNWQDAQRFCAWLSNKEGKSYRLPTDEEWSIAVGLAHLDQRKSGTTPKLLSVQEAIMFPWGGGFPPETPDKVGNYCDTSFQKKQLPYSSFNNYIDGFPTTAPVMSFNPNKLGLYDMGGNVWEWCQDWYDNSLHERVLRGASFADSSSNDMLSRYRRPSVPSERFNSCGFRCVIELPSAVSEPAPVLTPSGMSPPAGGGPVFRYADLITSMIWEGAAFTPRYRGEIKVKEKVLGPINGTNLRGLAFHPDGRIAYAVGNGATDSMALNYWKQDGTSSLLVKLKFKPRGDDKAERDAEEARGTFWVFAGKLAFNRAGNCFFVLGNPDDSIYKVLTGSPVSIEKWHHVGGGANALQIPAFDDNHFYVSESNSIYRVDMDKDLQRSTDTTTPWFSLRGMDIKFSTTLVLNPNTIITLLRIRPSGNESQYTFHALLLDRTQNACWSIPALSAYTWLALSWNGQKIIYYDSKKYQIVEIAVDDLTSGRATDR